MTPEVWWLAVAAAGAAVLTAPTNGLVRWVLARAGAEGERADVGTGRWIGILERLLIYTLVLAGEPGAAGLVVAAKTLLRFPEISGEHARLDPEYVIVGSLASWLAAFVVGAVVAGVG